MRSVLRPESRVVTSIIVLCLALQSGSFVAPHATAKSAAVRYVDMKVHAFSYIYAPQRLTVHAGTRVVWRNRSSAPHSVTSTGKQKAFSSSVATNINPGHQWSFVFNHPGVIHYYCVYHPYMKGVIVVTR